MADNARRESTIADEKAASNVIEDVNPYRGLSAEDAEFMRGYEGKAGKRVVRKVSHSCIMC